MNPIEVSVMIACYNDGQYLGQALDSVQAQTFKSWEIIVVDDGSDNTTIAQLKKRESQINRMLFLEHGGVSNARNKALQEAKGTYILVLDADDYLEPDAMEKALKVLQDENVTIASYQAYRFWKNKVFNVYKPKGGTLKDFLFNNEALGTSMYRREDLLAIGGYDESMQLGFEDWELHLRLLQKGGEAVVLEEPLYHYRKKPNSRNVDAVSNKYRILEYMVQKHPGIYGEKEVVDYLFKKLQQHQANTKAGNTNFEKKVIRLLRSLRGAK